MTIQWWNTLLHIIENAWIYVTVKKQFNPLITGETVIIHIGNFINSWRRSRTTGPFFHHHFLCIQDHRDAGTFARWLAVGVLIRTWSPVQQKASAELISATNVFSCCRKPTQGLKSTLQPWQPGAEVSYQDVNLSWAADRRRLSGGKWLSACLFHWNNRLWNLSGLNSHLWWLAVCQHNPDCQPSFTPATSGLLPCTGCAALNTDPSTPPWNTGLSDTSLECLKWNHGEKNRSKKRLTG